eukprot:SAG11_NODE_498_length_8940_cov_11.447121_6_plen_86_part_00
MRVVPLLKMSETFLGAALDRGADEIAHKEMESLLQQPHGAPSERLLSGDCQRTLDASWLSHTGPHLATMQCMSSSVRQHDVCIVD